MALRALREKKGISQEEFAKILGLDQTTISKWETAKASPKIGTVRKMAEVLGVSIEEIVSCF